MQGAVGGTVEVVELPCGGPQAALSYTAAIGRIARIPQWSGIRTTSRPGQLEYPEVFFHCMCCPVIICPDGIRRVV